MKKILVVGIILLFIGVAVAPSINLNVVKASQDDDLVEVTTQACGIKGYGNTTVKLTREQYQDLEQYLVEFRARLNQTTTKEELVVLYKEAIVELNTYGLLPKGMSIPLAERLVIGNALFDTYPGFFNRVKTLEHGAIENIKCFVYAQGNCYDVPLPFLVFTRIIVPIAEKILVGPLGILLMPLLFTYIMIGMVIMLLSTINPIHILSCSYLQYGSNLTTISFLPLKIYKENDNHDLIGFTGLKIQTQDIGYYFGRTILVINENW